MCEEKRNIQLPKGLQVINTVPTERQIFTGRPHLLLFNLRVVLLRIFLHPKAQIAPVLPENNGSVLIYKEMLSKDEESN